MTGIAGLLFALATLIFLALRGVNIIIAALLSSVIVLVTNDLDIAEGLTQSFAFGKLGAFWTTVGRPQGGAHECAPSTRAVRE